MPLYDRGDIGQFIQQSDVSCYDRITHDF